MVEAGKQEWPCRQRRAWAMLGVDSKSRIKWLRILASRSSESRRSLYFV